MESEKVKEIKEKLQEEIFIANSFGDKLRKVPTKELENLLILINELEKENELLRNAKVVYENVDYCFEDLKKAEKRIDELEKEIEENAFYSKGYAQGIKNTYEVVIPDKLKQFAEKLKKKDCSVPIHKGFILIEDHAIDETLKEFINE